ncbi:MAG: outer membrane beta-barrel protein [Bacteroidetes bacterium]|nr:outer membrane beta-barrel protein [Bacteroidota bacterium]
MNKTSYSLLAVVFILTASILTMPAYSQLGLQAGAGIGYAIPSGDLGGATTDFYAGTKYGLSDGINFHAKGRVNLLGFRLAAEIGYTSLNGNGTAEENRGKVELSQKCLAIKIGPEFHFSIPAFPLTPYLGLNVAMNNISGEITFNGITAVPSGTYTLNSSSRLGLGIAGGAILSIGPLMSLDIGISYNMMNLSGRKWEDADAARDRRLDSYTSLNDDKDPAALNGAEHFIDSARSIESIQINATVLFGL